MTCLDIDDGIVVAFCFLGRRTETSTQVAAAGEASSVQCYSM